MYEIYLKVVIGGLLIGTVYALIAMGLTIIFGVMRVVNFAHGEMVVVGMYVGYWAFTLTGASPLLALPLGAALLFVLGYGVQRWLVNPLLDQPLHMQFILFIALALIITALHLMLFGPDQLGVLSPASFETYLVGPLRIDAVKAQAAGIALCIMAGLWVFLRTTTLGQSIRACAVNRTGAQAIGIRIHHVYAVTAGIGAACAGVAGVLIAPLFDTHPFLAPEFTLLAFIIVIIGGLGSLPGALLGGILIGVSEGIAALLLEPSMKSLFSYGLLILVILLRPQGLLGAKGSA